MHPVFDLLIKLYQWLIGDNESLVQPPVILTFTRNAATGTSPLITAASAADADFIWYGPNGRFTGKQPNISNFPAGSFVLRSKKATAVTGLTFFDRKLTAFEPKPNMLFLNTLYLYSNASLVCNVHDIVNAFPLLQYLSVSNCLETSLNFSSLSRVPRDFWCNNIKVAGVGGGLNATPIPSDANNFLVSSASGSSLTGDISLCNFASESLNYIGVNNNTLLVYGTGGSMAGLMRNGSSGYSLNNCGLDQSEVDRVLADCVSSTRTGSVMTLAINAAPSAAGLLDKATLVSRGWTVTTAA